MANADYEQILKERGYQLVVGELVVPIQTVGFALGAREPLVTGSKQIGANTVEVQLQSVRTGRSAGLAVVSRVRGAGVRGEGILAPHGWLRGFVKVINSGPKITVFFMWFFIFAGAGVLMLPGMLLVGLLMRGLRANAGVQRFDALTAPGASSLRVWGKDLEAARQAMPHAVQEALAGSPTWFGNCEVRAGAFTLDRQIGYGRYDLFRGAIDAVEGVSAALPSA